jgi:hypothetical protein
MNVYSQFWLLEGGKKPVDTSAIDKWSKLSLLCHCNYALGHTKQLLLNG